MARARNYKAEYARRKALAQERGFGSYYQQRLRGGARATPQTPLPEDEGELRRRRGHAGPRALLRNTEPGSHITIATNLGELEKDDNGNYVSIPITVQLPDGTELDYWLTDYSDYDLDWLIGELDDLDVSYSPDYDLRNL